MNRSRDRRREFREKKIAKRVKIILQGGYQCGTLYEPHAKKLRKNSGYLSKSGTLLHYGRGTKPISIKTRKRGSYSGTTNWSTRDTRRRSRGSD